MARIRVKGIDEAIRRTKLKITAGIQSEGLLKDIGEFLVKNIKGSARTGKETESQKGFDDLEKSTIKNRDYLSRYNKTSSFYRRDKSNLTFSGQLLDSLKYKTNLRKGTVTVAPSGTRSPYRRKDGKAIKGQANTNTEVARHVSGSRPFMGTSKEMKQSILVLVRRELRRRLR